MIFRQHCLLFTDWNPKAAFTLLPDHEGILLDPKMFFISNCGAGKRYWGCTVEKAIEALLFGTASHVHAHEIFDFESEQRWTLKMYVHLNGRMHLKCSYDVQFWPLLKFSQVSWLLKANVYTAIHSEDSWVNSTSNHILETNSNADIHRNNSSWGQSIKAMHFISSTTCIFGWWIQDLMKSMAVEIVDNLQN